MQDVKEALQKAFTLAKSHGVVLRNVDFETYKIGNSAGETHVLLSSVNINCSTLKSDQK